MVDLVPSCLRGFVNCSRGYLDGQNFFLVAISWVPIFFSRVFRGSETFFRGSFVGPNLFSWVSLWVQDVFSRKFRRYIVNI